MATWPPPRRGAEKPTYRVFIGGSKLNDEYKLVGTRHYKYTSKRRSAKVINSIEQALLKAIDSNEISKFNGSIETTPSTKETELDKEGFVKQQKKKGSFARAAIFLCHSLPRGAIIFVDSIEVQGIQQIWVRWFWIVETSSRITTIFVLVRVNQYKIWKWWSIWNLTWTSDICYGAWYL